MSRLFSKLTQPFTQDIAIDLGTANIQVALQGQGIIIEEPSVVAVNSKNGQIIGIGTKAKQMAGKTPASVNVVRPLRDGVISDFDTTEAMIRYYIQEVFTKHAKPYQLNRPRVVIGVPSLITEVEARAVKDAARSAGANQVYLVEEPMAAAIGAGLPVAEAEATMIVDIGGGTTDIAILSLGGMVIDTTIKVAGDEMDETITEYLRHKYNLQISNKIAETVKIEVGSAYKLAKEKEVSVGGRDLLTGLPKSIQLGSVEVREALLTVLGQIVDAVLQAVEKAPPEMLVDLQKNGIFVVGGGAQLPGIDKLLSEKTKLPVKTIETPTRAVVNGVYALLEDIDLLDRVQVKENSFI